MNKFITIILLSAVLCSCGVKGDLYLPGDSPHKKNHSAETTNHQSNKDTGGSSNNQVNTDK